MNKEKSRKEELQTRREFFKNAAKSALPIVAGIVLSAMPQVINASSAAMGCNLYCQNGCSKTCKDGCEGCKGGCNTNCAVSCDKTCKANCADDCYKSCTGGNEAYRE